MANCDPSWIFHSYGKLVKKYAYGICGCWMVVLIIGIVLFPLRAKQANDIIKMWTPENGKVNYAVQFTDGVYDQQSYYLEQSGLSAMLDNMDNGDEFWRAGGEYFHIWGSAWSGRGDDITGRAATKEWYDFNIETLTMDFLVEGVNRTWHDVCDYQYATNSDFFHEGTGIGNYFFPGFNSGFLNAATGGMTGDATGTPAYMWDSIMLLYLENKAAIDAGTAAPNTHLTFHSLAVVGAAANDLILTLYSLGVPDCDEDNGISRDSVSCVSAMTSSTDQTSFNLNCEILVNGNSAALAAQWPTFTANQRTTICSEFLVYSSVPGVTDWQSTCYIADMTFCIQDAVANNFGTLFSAPLTENFYGESFNTIPSEADLNNETMSDEDFEAKMQTCGFLPYTRETNGKYYRTSKYVSEPVVLARRLQQQAGNCTYNFPDISEVATRYEAILSDDLKDREDNEGLPALTNLTVCSYVQTEMVQLATLQAEAEAAVAAGDLVTAGTKQAEANTILASQPCATYCGQCQLNYPYLAQDTAIVESVLNDVAAGALQFVIWYKSSGYWTCPDFNQDVIDKAMTIRQTVNDQLQAKTDEYNTRSTIVRASVLSGETIEEGYDALFSQNAILIIAGLTIMYIFVVVVNYDNWKIAFMSMFMIFLCVFCTLGFMEMPYTPSVIQFLPYLMIGIGVDDLFVVLSHYSDEDNIPKAMHHAGMAITITSLTNTIVFVLFRFITQVPDIRIFTGAAAIGVFLLYCNVLFGIAPIMYIAEVIDGRADDKHRPDDDYHEGKEQHGTQAQVQYGRCQSVLKPFKNIFAIVFIVLIFIAMTTIACLKMTGTAGFEEPKFGLKYQDLLETDENSHLYRSVAIFEDFPLFVFACGAGKSSGEKETTWNGEVFDDYAPRFIAYCNALDATENTFRTSTTWTLAITDDGPQAHPYYTNQVQASPLPDPAIYWYNQDRYMNSSIVVPQGSFLNVPVDYEGRTAADTIKRLYDVLDDYEDIGPYCTGTVIEVFERYLGVETQLLISVGVTILVVFVICLALIQDIGASLVLTLVDAATVFQLWGFFSIFGLRVNNVLILNIMFGAAFMAQYTAHLARRFVISPAPSRFYRMVDALALYSGPLLWGAMSTALAVSIAAFLPIKYFQLYYFRAFIIIVVFGLFNGLVVQSALLVLIPTSFSSAAIPMFGEEDDKFARRYSSSTNVLEMADVEAARTAGNE